MGKLKGGGVLGKRLIDMGLGFRCFISMLLFSFKCFAEWKMKNAIC